MAEKSNGPLWRISLQLQEEYPLDYWDRQRGQVWGRKEKLKGYIMILWTSSKKTCTPTPNVQSQLILVAIYKLGWFWRAIF